jgi:hypothetical protein
MRSNVGETRIEITSGTATGTIQDRDSRVVSANNIGLEDLGIPVDLDPGESARLRIFASTSGCDPQLGYQVPPGHAQLIAEVQGPDTTTLYPEPLLIVISG